MTSAKTLVRIERLIWILIYGGLFVLILGLVVLPVKPAAAWSMIVLGGFVAIAGVVLIWVRSRLEQTG